MQGSISIESTLGSGTTFTIRLPFELGEAPSAGLDARDVPSTTLSNCNILLVEDNQASQKLLVDILTKAEANVTFATIGRQAIEAAADKEFDVILMDCRLPDISGLEATRIIRNHEAQNHREPAMILALTANAFDSDIKKCLDAGMDAHLGKPIKRSKLLQAIAHSMSARTQLQEIHAAYHRPPQETLLDEEIILDTLEALGETEYKVYLDIMARNASTSVKQAMHATLSGNIDLATDALHSLKGSLGNAGFVYAHKLCELFEARTQEGGSLPSTKELSELDAVIRLTLGKALDLTNTTQLC
jgi:CheY-like chemotaxis protein/HPt (histidine-containing phosphotransfer) domain-containing protein